VTFVMARDEVEGGDAASRAAVSARKIVFMARVVQETLPNGFGAC
jgi:hypothetical protein